MLLYNSYDLFFHILLNILLKVFDYDINPYEDNIYYNQRSKNSYTNKDYSYCERSDVKTYDKITKTYTQEKLNELVKSNPFKKMVEEKGEDKDN